MIEKIKIIDIQKNVPAKIMPGKFGLVFSSGYQKNRVF